MLSRNQIPAEKKSSSRFIRVAYLNALFPMNINMDVTILAVVILLLGGNVHHISLLNVLYLWASVGASLIAPRMLEIIGNRKKMLIGLAAVSFFTSLTTWQSIVLFSPAAAIIIILGSMTLFTVSDQIRGMPWTDLIRTEIGSEKRIQVYTQTLTISFIILTAANAGFKKILESKMNFPDNYFFIFLFGVCFCGLHMVSMFFLERERHTSYKALSAVSGSILRFYKEHIISLKHNSVALRVILARLFFGISTQSVVFYIALGHKISSSDMTQIFGLSLFIRTIVKAVAYYFGGKIAARKGDKILLVSLGLCALISPLVSLFLPVKFYVLIIVFTFLVPMNFPFSINILMNVSDERKYKGYFALFNLVSFPASLLSPLFGLLVEKSPVLFNLIMLVFAIIIILLVVKIPRIKDGRLL